VPPYGDEGFALRAVLAAQVSGRLLLGYVLHERRPFFVEALIGLAPILLNLLGILLVTAMLTPLTLAQVTDPQFEVVKEVVLTSGFLTGSPASAATPPSETPPGRVPSPVWLGGRLRERPGQQPGMREHRVVAGR
jgi:hypothetical protein